MSLAEGYRLICKSAFVAPERESRPCTVLLSFDKKKVTVQLGKTASAFRLSKIKVSPLSDAEVKVQSDGLELIGRANDPALVALKQAMADAADYEAKAKQKPSPSQKSTPAVPPARLPPRDQTPTKLVNKRAAPLSSFSKSSGVVSASPVRHDSPVAPARQATVMSSPSPVRSPGPRFASSPAIRVQKAAKKSMFQSPSNAKAVTSSSSSASSADFFAETTAKLKTYGRKSQALLSQPLVVNFSEQSAPIFRLDEDSDSIEDPDNDLLTRDVELDNPPPEVISHHAPKHPQPRRDDSSPFLKYTSLHLQEKRPITTSKGKVLQSRAVASPPVPPATTLATVATLRCDSPPRSQTAAKVNTAAFFTSVKRYREENKESLLSSSRQEWKERIQDPPSSPVVSPLRPPLPPQDTDLPHTSSSRARIQSFFQLPPTDPFSMECIHTSKLFKGGVKNLGNSCYISSVLQAIWTLDALLDDMASFTLKTSHSREHKAGLVLEFLHLTRQRRSLQGERVDSTEEAVLQRRQLFSSYQRPLINAFTSSAAAVIDVTKLKILAASHNPAFAGWNQQDAHEFMTSLMSQVEDQLLDMLRYLWPSSSPHPLPSPQTVAEIPQTVSKDQSSPPDESTGSDSSIQLDELVSRPHTAVSSPSLPSFPLKSSPSSHGLDDYMTTWRAMIPTAFYLQSTMEVRMRCTRCGFQHAPREEIYRDFSLDLNDGVNTLETVTMPQLFQQFLQSEERELHCQRCLEGSTVALSKRMTMLAPCLVFHLKRFHYNANTSSYEKLHSPVAISSVLNLQRLGILSGKSLASKCKVMGDGRYRRAWQRPLQDERDVWALLEDLRQMYHTLSSSSGTSAQPALQYSLRAVVRHVGMDLDKGHYLCDVKDPQTGVWMRCNDAIVTEIAEDKVMSEEDTPYILFYQLSH